MKNFNSAVFMLALACSKNKVVGALGNNDLVSFLGRGRNSSVRNVLALLSCVMQCCGFDPPEPPVEGIFPLN